MEEYWRHQGYQQRPYQSLVIVFDRLIMLIKKDRGMLIQAWQENELGGTILLLFAGRTATCCGGGIRREFGRFYPVEFMYMSAMRLGKKRGRDIYDLANWVPKGVAQFKRGFLLGNVFGLNPEENFSDPVVRGFSRGEKVDFGH